MVFPTFFFHFFFLHTHSDYQSSNLAYFLITFRLENLNSCTYILIIKPYLGWKTSLMVIWSDFPPYAALQVCLYSWYLALSCCFAVQYSEPKCISSIKNLQGQEIFLVLSWWIISCSFFKGCAIVLWGLTSIQHYRVIELHLSCCWLPWDSSLGCSS